MDSDPSFPVDEDAVIFSGQAPRSCVILENVLNEHEDPTVKCEDIDGSYKE